MECKKSLSIYHTDDTYLRSVCEDEGLPTEGKYCNLTCIREDGRPYSHVTWYHNSVFLNTKVDVPSGRHLYSGTGESVLTISNLSPNDTGCYKCMRGDTDESHTHFLQVHCKYKTILYSIRVQLGKIYNS